MDMNHSSLYIVCYGRSANVWARVSSCVRQTHAVSCDSSRASRYMQCLQLRLSAARPSQQPSSSLISLLYPRGFRTKLAVWWCSSWPWCPVLLYARSPTPSNISLHPRTAFPASMGTRGGDRALLHCSSVSSSHAASTLSWLFGGVRLGLVAGPAFS